MSTKKNIVIIGAGRGGNSLLEILNDGKYTSVVGIADSHALAPGLRQAELLNVSTFIDYREMLNILDYDIVINVTGSLEVERDIDKLRSPGAQIISGSCAHLIWDLIDEHLSSRIETKKRLNQFQDLYHLGLVLSSSQELREVNNLVIDYATKLTKYKAGSIVLLDNKTGEMVLKSAKGFTPDFYRNKRWKLRPGGLTEYILNQKSPVVISNIEKYHSFNNETLIREKIKSIAAAPLVVDGRILGILYVDDFEEHKFNQEDIYIFTLISTYAALAIERTKLLEDTRRMAITDALTGLYNHRYLFSRLDEEVKRSMRYHHPMAIITFDIDFFKTYNDSHGHLQGNEALSLIGKITKENSRQLDICARNGGEEFVIVMPETNKNKAYELAERLRKKVDDLYFKGEESQPGGSLTISIGVAGLLEDSSESIGLINKADQALYEAKRRGRNQVVAFQKGMQEIGVTCKWSS